MFGRRNEKGFQGHRSLLAYRHGLRDSEVGALTIQDLDLEKRKIYIRRLKGSLSGEYLLQDDEHKVLKAYLMERKRHTDILLPSNRGDPMERKTLHCLFVKYGERAGIPKKKRHFHILKHSIAIHLVEAGADIFFIREWVGNKNIPNTLVSAQMTSKLRDEKARGLDIFLSRDL